MSSPKKTRGLLLCLALVLSICSGCHTREFSRFDYEMDNANGRQLYAPMVAGQEALLRTLQHVDHRPLIFTLGPDHCELQNIPFSEEHLLDESKAIFFQVPTKTAGAYDLHYFNPRTLKLEALITGGAPLTTEDRPLSDLVVSEPGRMLLFRSIVNRTTMFSQSCNRSLFRFEFTVTADGKPIPAGQQRLTADNGLDLMPEPDPLSQQIIYLHRDDDSTKVHRLMKIGFADEEPQPMFAEQEFDILYPRRLSDGRLIFSANPEGYYRQYQLVRQGENQPVTFKPLETPLPDDAVGSKVLLATMPNGGKFTPTLITLPESYNLQTICALVSAYNPQINKQRALLAAALIETGQARLANWPSLTWGLFYTPVVGIFLDDPVVSSGDFLAEGISRGLLGLVQPIFDFSHNKAMEKAQCWRAEMTRDALLNEENERLAEAAELYFEAQYLQRMLAVNQQLLAAMDERLEYLLKRRAHSEATLAHLLAAEQTTDRLQADSSLNVQRLAFLQNRLKQVCGLPEASRFSLADESYMFQDYTLEPLGKMRATALLHHPNLKAAKASLARAFFLGRSGAGQRPTAYLGATYGQSREEFSDAVDDYLTLTINGKYPLGSMKSKKLHSSYWNETIQALKIERQAQQRIVAISLEETYMNFRAAQGDLHAKESALLYQLEKLRVARLNKAYRKEKQSDISTPRPEIAARLDFLGQKAKVFEAEMELGKQFTRVWRELGLSARLSNESTKWKYVNFAKEKPATWLWKTQEIVKSDATIRDFIAFAKQNGIRRVYAYLYSDSRLLANRSLQEKMTLFVNFCDRADIEVWGLLGEPEWLEKDDEAALERAISRLTQWQKGLDKLEPRLAGVKLDIEPHSKPEWHKSPELRAKLTKKYLRLIGSARKNLDGIVPLWVDVPVQFFRPENAALLSSLATQVDGATLMCYFANPEQITKEAKSALTKLPLAMEIGIEFSSKAPATDSLADLPLGEFNKFRNNIMEALRPLENFSGLAYHDFQALKRYVIEAH